jgi:ribosomal protein S20
LFDEKVYTFSVAENSRPGHVIGSVRARDEDKGRNGEVEYRLRTTIKKFSIEAKSGERENSIKHFFVAVKYAK